MQQIQFKDTPSVIQDLFTVDGILSYFTRPETIDFDPQKTPTLLGFGGQVRVSTFTIN